MNRPALIASLLAVALGAGWALTAARLHANARLADKFRAERDDLQSRYDVLRRDTAAKRPAGPLFAPPPHSSSAPPAASPPSPSGGETLSVAAIQPSDAGHPPPLTEETINAITRFDAAMDQEFERLEAREEASSDDAEVTTLNRIKDQLAALDELYRRADKATTDDERAAIRVEMQKTMGNIIGLSRVDRNERLAALATQVGYTDPAAVETFVREIDRIYHETHMDWTKLFNRGPPPATDGAPGSISPGP